MHHIKVVMSVGPEGEEEHVFTILANTEGSLDITAAGYEELRAGVERLQEYLEFIQENYND